MSLDNGLVLLGAAAVIAAIAWWFFGHSLRTRAAVKEGGVQEVVVVVEGGYDPATIHVRSGTPVRLIFDRRESEACSEEVVLPAFSLRKFLPPHEKTAVEFTPQQPGTYPFTCGMSMLRGRLIVEAAS